MPLSNLQVAILRSLASRRSLASFVAGSTPLNLDGPRFSEDIDVFNDRVQDVDQAAIADVDCLEREGFAIEWLRREKGIHTVRVRRDDEATRLEWVIESDFRFFPAQSDSLFGYRLHLADIATNKALAAAGRREPRDLLDLVVIHERYLPLGAVVWAAVGKDIGFSPENLIAEIRRNGRYRPEDFSDIRSAVPVDPAEAVRRLRAALEEAEGFARAMPAGIEGQLFLQDGEPVQPNLARLADYTPLAGRRQGVRPSSSEIGSAMLEHHGSQAS